MLTKLSLSGYRHISVFTQRVTNSLRCIMHKNGYFITNYIDNLIGCDKQSLFCITITNWLPPVIHKWVCPARLFVNRILATLREAPSGKQHFLPNTRIP